MTDEEMLGKKSYDSEGRKRRRRSKLRSKKCGLSVGDVPCGRRLDCESAETCPKAESVSELVSGGATPTGHYGAKQVTARRTDGDHWYLG